MNLDLTQELAPDSSIDEAEFKFVAPLPEWDNDKDSSVAFDRSLNRYGAVYVRLLKAQRLPCPVGSSVVGAASLPPFAGRVKTHRRSAFLSSATHGVCVQWDRGTNDGLLKMVSLGAGRDDDDSPIPSIQISLLFSPLGMGIFDFTMCDLSLSCEVLMKSPGVWKKAQWCQAYSDSVNTTRDDAAGVLLEDTTQPLILLEAMFQPSEIDSTIHTSVLSPAIVRKKKLAREAAAATATATGGVIATTPRRRLPLAEESPPSSEAKDILDDHMTTPVKEKDINEVFDASRTAVAEGPTNPHMLRIASFWVPSACSVCSTILIGNKKGFHCEACSIICCVDCRLNVDLEIPCGSEEARSKVANSIQNKISVNNILSIVAPDESYAEKNLASSDGDDEDGDVDGLTSSLLLKTPSHSKYDGQAGIGCLRIEFQRASLFEQPLLPDESPENTFSNNNKRPTREGEYYARITSSMGSNKTARTRPVYSGSPQFNSQLIELMVSHYGEEFRLDCVDSRTDEVVGTALLSTQGILQDQRDEEIKKHGASLFQCFRGPLVAKGQSWKRVMLRTGVKNAFGLDFYVTSKEVASESEKGAISGWLEVSLGLEEFVGRLYHPQTPVECPARPPEDFNTAMFQVHVMRAKIILEELKALLELYLYTVSWRDPLLTGCSFVVLVWLCLRFNTEYIGSLPACALLLSLIYSSRRQSQKGRKEPFIRREVEASRETAKISVDYFLHRPVGTISVSVPRGRALVSRDLGIPGRVVCKVFYDPLRFASSKKVRSKVIKNDKAAESLHEMGGTGAVLSADPEWNVASASVENMRLRQLFRHAEDFFVDGPELPSPLLTFPVLRPFEVKGWRRDASGRFVDGVLKGWETSTGAVVLQIRLSIGFDQVLGEVVVPLSKIVAKREIKGWFQVLEAGTKNLAPILQLEHDDTDIDVPRIQIDLKWNPPVEIPGQEETQRETSVAVQEELVRSSQLSKQVHFDLVGSSIGAMNTALGLGGNIQSIQNTLGAVLDAAETALNAFNFTDPFKSSLLFVAISALALVLLLIPTRYLVLAGVLAQFGLTFVDRYGKALYDSLTAIGLVSSASKQHREGETELPSADGKDPAFLEKWFMNGLRSLPTNEDLRRHYFWQSRRLGSHEKEKFASEKRVSRLHRLWKARWHSAVEILTSDNPASKSTGNYHWQSSFAVVEGRRFLLWESVVAFDSGELATGHVVLSGHAGITNPSPVEAREIPEEVVSRVVSIFGRGSGGQQRVTMILPDAMAKTALETAVSEIASKDH